MSDNLHVSPSFDRKAWIEKPRIENPHPLVVAVTRAFKNDEGERKRGFDDGIFRPVSFPRLVSVTWGSLQRALVFLDRLVKEMERRGWRVERESDAEGYVAVCVDGEQIPIRIKEKTASSPHIPTPAERRRIDRDQWFHGVPSTDVMATGELAVAIDLKWRGMICRHTDGKDRRIEDAIEPFISQIQERVRVTKEKRAKEEAERQRQATIRAVEHQARDIWNQGMNEYLATIKSVADRRQQLRDEERRRIRQLMARIKSWRRAKLIRQYVRESNDRKGGPDGDPWLAWAARYADSIDPTQADISADG